MNWLWGGLLVVAAYYVHREIEAKKRIAIQRRAATAGF